MYEQIPCVCSTEWLIQCFCVFHLGAERLSEGRSSEALSGLQTASSLPAPRTLVAYTHLLSGSCLALMVRTQTEFLHKYKEKIRMARALAKQVWAFACSESVCVCVCLQSCPQMALHCYRKALETDPRCVCALYQSILTYRQLGNTQAEIQALRLLHSVSNTGIQYMQGRQWMWSKMCL